MQLCWSGVAEEVVIVLEAPLTDADGSLGSRRGRLAIEPGVELRDSARGRSKSWVTRESVRTLCVCVYKTKMAIESRRNVVYASG